MMMSREASRPASGFGTLMANANRHRLFTSDGQDAIWLP